MEQKFTIDKHGIQYKATNTWNSIVAAFRQGVPRARHRRYMRAADDCFPGSTAVVWLLNYLRSSDDFQSTNIGRQQVISLLNKFYKASIIQEVGLIGRWHRKREFYDCGRLYRLQPVASTKAARNSLASATMTSNLHGDHGDGGGEDFSPNTHHFQDDVIGTIGQHVTRHCSVRDDDVRMRSGAKRIKRCLSGNTDMCHGTGCALPRGHLVAKFLTQSEIDKVWKTAAENRLMKILGVDCLDDLLQGIVLDGSCVRQNCVQSDKYSASGINSLNVHLCQSTPACSMSSSSGRVNNNKNVKSDPPLGNVIPGSDMNSRLAGVCRHALTPVQIQSAQCGVNQPSASGDMDVTPLQWAPTDVDISEEHNCVESAVLSDFTGFLCHMNSQPCMMQRLKSLSRQHSPQLYGDLLPKCQHPVSRRNVFSRCRSSTDDFPCRLGDGYIEFCDVGGFANCAASNVGLSRSDSHLLEPSVDQRLSSSLRYTDCASLRSSAPDMSVRGRALQETHEWNRFRGSRSLGDFHQCIPHTFSLCPVGHCLTGAIAVSSIASCGEGGQSQYSWSGLPAHCHGTSSGSGDCKYIGCRLQMDKPPRASSFSPVHNCGCFSEGEMPSCGTVDARNVKALCSPSVVQETRSLDKRSLLRDVSNVEKLGRSRASSGQDCNESVSNSRSRGRMMYKECVPDSKTPATCSPITGDKENRCSGISDRYMSDLLPNLPGWVGKDENSIWVDHGDITAQRHSTSGDRANDSKRLATSVLKRSWDPHIREHSLSALQVLCLFLPPVSRRKLYTLVKMMNKMASNQCLVFEDSLCTRSVVLGTFQSAIIGCGDGVGRDPVSVFLLVSSLVDHYRQVLQVPPGLRSSVEERLRLLEMPQTSYSPRDPNTILFSRPVSAVEYAMSGINHSYNALLGLLDSIIGDQVMGRREKRRRLKQVNHPGGGGGVDPIPCVSTHRISDPRSGPAQLLPPHVKQRSYPHGVRPQIPDR